MNRTTLMLPEDLQRQAALAAERQGISMGELIRRSLMRETAIAYQVGGDQFWQPPATFRSRGGAGVGTLAADHDEALYGPITHGPTPATS